PIKDTFILIFTLLIIVGLVAYNSFVFIVGPYLHIQAGYQKSMRMLSIKENVSDCHFIQRHYVEVTVNVAKCLDQSTLKLFLYDDLGNKLAEIANNDVHYDELISHVAEYKLLMNPEFSISFYDNQVVYRMKDKTHEYLIDIKKYTILWKVDLNYE
ncbi:MAG: hypothetical protein WCI62_05385, partial [Erysipelotrichaceae bacterium]